MASNLGVYWASPNTNKSFSSIYKWLHLQILENELQILENELQILENELQILENELQILENEL